MKLIVINAEFFAAPDTNSYRIFKIFVIGVYLPDFIGMFTKYESSLQREAHNTWLIYIHDVTH